MDDVGRPSSDCLLYLSAAEVSDLLPSLLEQVALTEQTLSAMRTGQAQLPPKPQIHPRPDTFIHAMPAYLAGSDIAALKWIGGSSRNRAKHLPYLSGLIVLNDPETARPRAILDAAEITAARTAAVTAACIKQFAQHQWKRVALVGYGVQGRAHERAVRALNESATIDHGSAHDDLERESLREVVKHADIVVTSIRFGNPPAPFINQEWLARAQLVVAVDFDASVQASAVTEADTFVVDHLETFKHYQGLGYFQDWPEPGRSLTDDASANEDGARVICCNLGVGTLDAAFAHAVHLRARAEGRGTPLT